MNGDAPILVVGGLGRLGERVACRLAGDGANVRVLTRSPQSSAALGLEARGCRMAEGDADRRWTLWKALEGCRALVSCSHIRHSPALVQACERMGVSRIVCLSSARLHSKVPSRTVGQVKRGERAVGASGLDWTILRPTMIYGGARDGNVQRIMDFAQRVPVLPIVGDGGALVQPVFVEDVVSAVVESLNRDASIGRAYDLGGPEPMTYADFLRAIGRAADRRVRLLRIPKSVAMAAAGVAENAAPRLGVEREAVLRLAEDKTVDIGPAQRDLGFFPRPFAEGLRMKAAGEAEVEALYPAPH